MKIIELTENQFKNYSNTHNQRNYYQTIEYAKSSNCKYLLLGLIDESNNISGATLILQKKIGNFIYGLVPGGLLIDYDNEKLVKDFLLNIKMYLKEKKYIFLEINNDVTYRITKNKKIIYYNTNILKWFDEASLIKQKNNNKMIIDAKNNLNILYNNLNSNTKRNINLSLKRAIEIYVDNNNENIDSILSLYNKAKQKYIKNIISNFNDKDNVAKIYYSKINVNQYINNYRYLLKEEEKYNERLSKRIQNSIGNIDKTISKKMISDKLKNKYQNEIIKATKIASKFPNGVIVNAILVIKNNREVYFLDEAYNKNIDMNISSHLIKWEIIKKYMLEGYKIFNLGEVGTPNIKDGKYKFKHGFGGDLYETIGTYDLAINKFLYSIIKVVKKIKR